MRFGMLAAAAASCALAAPASALIFTGTISEAYQVVPLSFDFEGIGSYRIDYRFSAPVADLTIGGYVEEKYNRYDPSGDYEGGNEIPRYVPEMRSNTVSGVVSFAVPRPYVRTYADGSTRVGSYRLVDASAVFYLAEGSGPVSYTIRTIAVPSGVPEPATWALMILGFGAIAAATRKRRVSTSSIRRMHLHYQQT